MAEFPAFPFFTDAYLADTAHLDDAEHGRYDLILFHLWRAPNQRFPNDDAWLARKFSRPVDRVILELRPLISEFCQCDGNWITQKRLSKEWEWVSKKRKSNSEAAKLRWEKEKAQCESNANTDDKCNAPNPTPPHNELGSKRNGANGFLVGKNGAGHQKGGVTIKDPGERLARFQKYLAEKPGKLGWEIVVAAADPDHPRFAAALEICKARATEIGKGWPHHWPTSKGTA